MNDRNNITWKVVACCACAVLWAILFWKMTTMSDNQDILMRDMAVVKNVLRIDSHQARSTNNHKDYLDY